MVAVMAGSTGLSRWRCDRRAGRGAGSDRRRFRRPAHPDRSAAAEDAFEDPALLIPQYLGISAVLALAFWLVKGSLDAMRVGLLNRFMGMSASLWARPSCSASAR